MTLTLPRVIGHRGAAAHAPENTLASFRKAAALGVEMVEFDVKLTRNRVPVVIHDDTLDRTTDGSGPIANSDFAAVRMLDAGRKFAPEFRGERVPTLDEVLTVALELGLAVNIEIKPCPGREVETAEVALAAAQKEEPVRFDTFGKRIAALTPLLDVMIPRVAALGREQQRAVQDIAIAELTRQQERLADYTTQARFAVAQLYDRAYATNNKEPERAPAKP